MGQENRENLELKCFSSVISMSTFKCTAKLFFKNFNENLQANLAFYQERMLFIYKPSEDVLTHWRFFSEHFFHIGRPSDKTLSHRSFCFTDCHFPTQAKKYPENSQSDLLLPDWLWARHWCIHISVKLFKLLHVFEYVSFPRESLL